MAKVIPMKPFVKNVLDLLPLRFVWFACSMQQKDNSVQARSLVCLVSVSLPAHGLIEDVNPSANESLHLPSD